MESTEPFWTSVAIWVTAIIGFLSFYVILYRVAYRRGLVASERVTEAEREQLVNARRLVVGARKALRFPPPDGMSAQELSNKILNSLLHAIQILREVQGEHLVRQ